AKQDAERLKCPASGRIEDAPRHDWRGCLLDVSRHFWTHDEVTRFLDIMAWYRLNTFHWHLTDDEAWRIEIPELPELTGIGATRAPNSAMLPQLGDTTETSYGFYTKEQIRAVVEHAQSLGIEVVPEVDIPGPCKAALTALPYL
ncbi:family 20 glycosylhydrolase, partial [Cellulomonas iranensis]|uniref:family 20 glycosylhydrolase n=1 Tax=Cellulomonas iranensis TaxID=76862 RepID=UPI0015C68F5D